MSVSRIVTSVFALAVLSAAADGPRRLSTAAEARAFADAISQEAGLFSLTGRVIAVLTSKDLVLEDASGIVRLRMPTAGVSRGDLLAVGGHTQVDYSRAKTLHVETATTFGHTTPDAPVDIRLDRPVEAALDCRQIRTEGLVVNVSHDSINPNFVQLTLRAGTTFMVAAWQIDPDDEPDLNAFFGKHVRITGIFERHRGGRRFFAGPIILLAGPQDIEILEHIAEDAFDVPELPYARIAEPSQIAALGRHRVSGTVLAVWHRNTLLILTDDARHVCATLAGNVTPPTCGTRVLVAGSPDTDLLQINLVNAVWRKDPQAAAPAETPVETSVSSLFRDEQGRPRFDVARHGHALCVQGRLRDVQPFSGRIVLQDGDDELPVNISACPQVLDTLSSGSTLAVTGVAIVESDSWRPNVILPDIRGLFLVIRSPDDIRVLAEPPWWTVNRLLIVICTLAAGLLVILAWNRTLNRIVVRRSRALAREQVSSRLAQTKAEERTRLAVELHDALSQNLEGLACQLAATESVLPADPGQAETFLTTAGKMLDSSRNELRRCLFDLRSDALNARDFNTAIQRTLAPIAARAVLQIDFGVRRSNFTESQTHAILAIVRELVSNAIRHGRATNIAVEGVEQNGRLKFTVSDDGAGFAPGTQPGPADGHFGLQGVSERIRPFAGTIRLDSRPGGPTRIEISMNTSTNNIPS